MPPIIIKKYGNRRLYDTDESRYITLEELTRKIQQGSDVRVVDAKTNEDLTQSTLTQLIIEGRGADSLFPPALLHQLVRLQDDALAEFLGRYLQGALELYLQAKRSSAVLPFNPFAALTGFVQNTPFSQWATPIAAEAMPTVQPNGSELDAMRRELDELKRTVQKRRR